jgi:cytochrome P450
MAEIAAKIAANAPIAVRKTKETVLSTMTTTYEEARAIEKANAEMTIRTEDAREGPLAFMEALPVRRRARTPSNHLTFGHGEHFCLGANMARWELRATFRALAPHLAHLELAGPPTRLPGLHVGAVAHLPVRWTS